MASRESQGLQIALILFVMVTVVLAITTYVYFRKSEEKIAEARTARESERAAKDEKAKVDDENRVLKHVLGYEPKPETELATIKAALVGNKLMEDVFNNFDQDMSLYGVGLDKDRLNYRNLPKQLLDGIQVRNTQLADANAQVKVLQAEKDQAREDESKRRLLAEKGQQDAQTDLASQRQVFSQARTEFSRTSDQLAGTISGKDKQLAQLSAAAAKEKEELEKKKETALELAKAYHDKLEKLTEKPSERAAGEVTYVEQRSNTVYINLGSVDGVEKMMNFSVIDQAEVGKGMTKAKAKGRIQVIKVSGEHTAEARIIENAVRDPILNGDKIYSPSFKPGQKIHFALVGLMDIDGDGKSDQAKVKSIITMNNGVVDSELLDDDSGTISGKMTSETRYLVQGQRPTDKTKAKAMEGYTRMIGDASNLGIEAISLPKLLDRMGYVQENRVRDLQRSSATKKDEGNFKSRSPNSAYGKK